MNSTESSAATTGDPQAPMTDRQVAEMIANFRTPPGFNPGPLADDIETLLKGRPRLPASIDWYDIERLASGDYTLCDGYCHEFCSMD